MSAETTAGGTGGDRHLYASRVKVYPQKISGQFRNIKWTVMAITLGIYYFLPFVRWDRGPNAPDQAVLIDFPTRRFYFFFIEIWPQEFYYLTGLLIIASMALFLMNALAGRIWCGYMCPQTVWTDLFYAVERLIEGDRRERMQLDKQGWSFMKLAERTTKHMIWILIAWWTGGAWVLYFADAPTLMKDLASFQAPIVAYLWIGILTFTTYLLAGFAREQVCTYMCPWPRIQAALTDEWALNVTYRYDRGEPRGSLKRMKARLAEGKPAGDCIDCRQCVAVCPTGIDIRDGVQLSCIQCGLCIDACDAVMKKIDRPTRLIAYDTDINIQRRTEGKENIYKFFRARTVIYPVIIAAIGVLMIYTLATRATLDISVLHDRNPLFVNLSDGGIRNGYTVRLVNKRLEEAPIALTVSGMEITEMAIVGVEERHEDGYLIRVAPNATRELRVSVSAPKDETRPDSVVLTFTASDLDSGEVGTVSDFFKGP